MSLITRLFSRYMQPMIVVGDGIFFILPIAFLMVKVDKDMLCLEHRVMIGLLRTFRLASQFQ